MVGGFMAGSANNGAHAANGLTAMFIATGQDVANIAESHAGDHVHAGCSTTATTTGRSRCRAHRGDLRRRHRPGHPARVPGAARLLRHRQGHKLAEICAATVLAGEISLTAAVLAGDWVASHERLGRNR